MKLVVADEKSFTITKSYWTHAKFYIKGAFSRRFRSYPYKVDLTIRV